MEKANQGGAEFPLTGCKRWDYLGKEIGVWKLKCGKAARGRIREEEPKLRQLCCTAAHFHI